MDELPKHDEEFLPHTHPVMQFVYRMTNRFHMKDNRKAWPFRLSWWSPSGWRIFNVTVGFYRWETTPSNLSVVKDWTWLEIQGPGIATKQWRNGLFHLALHLPFQVAFSFRIPKKFAGERWGWMFQFSLGWKVTGNLSGTLRINPDLVDHYKVGIQGTAEEGWQHWRARGLEGGDV